MTALELQREENGKWTFKYFELEADAVKAAKLFAKLGAYNVNYRTPDFNKEDCRVWLTREGKACKV